MNKDQSLSKLEHLPNEIFLHIFQYINICHLYRIWSKFNQRFANLLHAVSISAHLIEKNDYKNYKFCFRSHILQMIYIRIEQNCDIPEKFNLNHFSNIRSLHLDLITDKQYDQITPDNMPYLTHLTINALHGARNPAFLLFGSKQFVYLKSCHLPYIFHVNAHLQPCLTLRSLHLNSCSPEIFMRQVKPFLPNLVYFRSVIGTEYSYFTISEDEQRLITPYKTLRHVKMKLYRISLRDFFPLFLSILPELQCLELYAEYCYDFQMIATLLETKVPRLKKFCFIVQESGIQGFPDIEILKSMSFWFSQMKLEENGEKKRIACNVQK